MLKPIVTTWAVALLVGGAAPAFAAPAPAADSEPSEGISLVVQPIGQRAQSDSKLKLDMADSLRAQVTSRRAKAEAVVYTNRRGAVTGVKIKAAGLPDAERVGGPDARYVVWLVGQNGRRMQRLGELESRNGARADFGFTAETPLAGYDSLVITTEPRGGGKGPTGRQQFSADLTRMILSRM